MPIIDGNIYDHSSNQKMESGTSQVRHKFFYAPITLLDHESATSSFNNLTSTPEMSFRVQLWNDQVQTAVTSWIKREINSTAKDSFIQVIPFEKIVLTSTMAFSQQQSRYQISKEWIPYQLEKDVWFTLTCFTLNDCQELAQQMRKNPMQFKELRIAYSVDSQRSQKRETNIRIDNILSGQLGAKLQQRMAQEDFVLLRAEDHQRLVAESATNVIHETVDDSDDVPSPASEKKVYEIIEKLFDSSRITLKSQSDRMWNSVFWNEDNYRPDRVATTLNEVYDKLEKDDQKKLAEAFSNTNKVAGVEVSTAVIASVKANLDMDFSRSGDTSSDTSGRFLQEAKKNVQ